MRQWRRSQETDKEMEKSENKKWRGNMDVGSDENVKK